MNDQTVVLVTGVSGYWGRRLAADLLEEPEIRVVGVDTVPPAEKVPGLDFVQADLRNPLLAELLQEEQIRVCCHLKIVRPDEQEPGSSDLRSAANVVGTMNVLAACAEAGVTQVVLKSSMLLYGAHADNSAFLPETSPLRSSPRDGVLRDLLEVEGYADAFRAQHEHMSVAVLRFAHIVGPAANTPMTRFLKLPAPPVLLGFDPLLQLVHEADVVAALIHALTHPTDGAYNVAADDRVPLTRVLRLVNRRPLPIFHPLAYRAAKLLRGAVAAYTRWTPIEWDYLRYSCTGDLSRMHRELQFEPRYTAVEALADMVDRQRTAAHGYGREHLSYDEQRLRDTLERRRQAKQQADGRNSDAAAGDT